MRPYCGVSGARAVSVMALLGRRGYLKVQMLFWRICSPTQQKEKNRHQTGERGDSGENLPESTGLRWFRCRRTCHQAKTWRTGQLSFFVCYTFTTECSSAMRTPCRGFTQRMKKAASMAQARRRVFVELGSWFLRTHSSVWRQLWKEPRNLRRLIGRRAPPMGNFSGECLAAL
jgi:hypothetical protein